MRVSAVSAPSPHAIAPNNCRRRRVGRRFMQQDCPDVIERNLRGDASGDRFATAIRTASAGVYVYRYNSAALRENEKEVVL